MGGNITYKCISVGVTTSDYLVQVDVFRDCNGINMTNAITIHANTICNPSSANIVAVLPLKVGYPTIVTPICPTEPDVCLMGINALYGVEKFIYIDTITLTNGCDWELSWNSCCRNMAITTLANPGSESTYLETTIFNSGNYGCNSSPNFLNDPLFFTGVNQATTHSDGGYDPDGDSLVFYLSNCLSNNNQPVIYASGYNAQNPLSTANGFNLNSATGNITFNPNIVQHGVVNLIVEEYRNGVKIGKVSRDVYIAVTNMPNNTIPTLSGINGTANASGTTGNFIYPIFPNMDTIQFDLEAYDPDINQSLTWSTQNYPIGAYLLNNGNPNGKQFFWTPTAGNFPTSNISFSVKVRDNACPVRGRALNVYTLRYIPFSLNGTVNRSNGQPLDNSMIVLLDDNYNPVDTTTTNGMGQYSFNVHTASGYLVAIPNPQLHSDQLITYYDQASVIQSATPITMQPSTIVNFNTLPTMPSNSGNRAIGGILLNANAPNPAMANIPLIVVNDNDMPLKRVITNTIGEFTFNGLDLGEYKIWVDKNGIDNSLTSSINVIANNWQRVDSIIGYLHANHLEIAYNIQTNTENIKAVENLQLSPNPATDDVWLSFRLNQPTFLTIEVFDLKGQSLGKISEGQQAAGAWKRNLQDVLNGFSGICIIRIQTNEGVISRRLIYGQ
jgi:hypothetical protein